MGRPAPRSRLATGALRYAGRSGGHIGAAGSGSSRGRIFLVVGEIFSFTILCDVKVQVHRSALKHGLGVNEVVGLWGQGVEQVWLEDDRPGRVLRVCCDDSGR